MLGLIMLKESQILLESNKEFLSYSHLSLYKLNDPRRYAVVVTSLSNFAWTYQNSLVFEYSQATWILKRICSTQKLKIDPSKEV